MDVGTLGALWNPRCLVWDLSTTFVGGTGDVRSRTCALLLRVEDRGRMQTRAAALAPFDLFCRSCVPRTLSRQLWGCKQVVSRRVVRLVQLLGAGKRPVCYRVAARLSRRVMDIPFRCRPVFASSRLRATMPAYALMLVIHIRPWLQGQDGVLRSSVHDPHASKYCIHHTPHATPPFVALLPPRHATVHVRVHVLCPYTAFPILPRTNNNPDPSYGYFDSSSRPPRLLHTPDSCFAACPSSRARRSNSNNNDSTARPRRHEIKQTRTAAYSSIDSC